MSVPDYGELGKSARDVFREGYAYDLAKLKLSAKLGVEADVAFDLRKSELTGSFLGKYSTNGYGQFSGKLSRPSLLTGEYKLNGFLSENVDLDAGYTFNLADNFQTCRVRGKFHNSLLHADGSITKDLDGDAVLHGSAVLKLGKLLLGYQAEFKPNGSRLSKNDLALGCEIGNSAALHLRCLRIPKELGLSGFYSVSDKLDVAVDAKLGLGDESRPWYLGAGLAYKLNEQSKLRLKLDKNLQLGTSLQMPLNEEAKVTLAMNLDLAQPASGQHKVGLGLDLEV
ncbi:voltage-dependent anion-selective channel-like [Nasonia vitripennis]|uniref:Uncharacterized protein n=1 Tax=Nasonia vitripennis TaxID=7425 RepID=A0A7M7G6R3_NASVI|nr:voltage-dependent anion-selective channel-like [Nasonia vitripennis]